MRPIDLDFLDFVEVRAEGVVEEEAETGESPEVLAMIVLGVVVPSATAAVKENRAAIPSTLVINWFAVESLFMTKADRNDPKFSTLHYFPESR